MALDERLRRELERAAPPADPSGVYEDLIRRRERRHMGRRIRATAAALLVAAASVAALMGLAGLVDQGDGGRIGQPLVQEGIAFFQVDDTRGTLYIADPNGTELSAVASFADAFYASLSPSGDQVAFTRSDPENRGLWIADADGADARRLTVATSNLDSSPAWSPDADRIVFERNATGHGELFLINPDGSGLTQLTHNEVGMDYDPSWSPDGTQIVFGRNSGGPMDLYVVPVDGSEPRRLTTLAIAQGTVGSPDWSPDGSHIVFTVYQGKVRTRDIFVVAADGSSVTRLTDDPADDTAPVWSPDGGSIAFLSGRRYSSSPLGVSSAYDLFVMRPDGSDVRRIELAEPLTARWTTSVAWLPGLPPTAPDATPTEDRTTGEDIGLGFPVCDVTSVPGQFAPDLEGTAFVATRTGDTGDCSTDEGGSQLVAVDVTGDGEADASYGPLECDPFCSAFAAPDVDGDGTDELLVQNVQFSIAGLRLYDVRYQPPDVAPVTMSTPGYPEGGLPEGSEPQLWTGGDAFQTNALRCEERAAGRVLVFTSASEEPPDSVVSRWIASEITFRLDADGTVAVIDHRTFEEPASSDDPSFATGPTICGASIPRLYRGG